MADNVACRGKRVLAFIVGSTLCSSAALAADAGAPAKGMADQRLMVSQDGFKAERDIGAARIAIFQGDTDAAKKLVGDAKSDLSTVAQKAPKDFPNGAAPAGGKGAGDPDVIPIDGQMIVADNMVLTPDKAAKVGEADQHLKQGDTAKALDTLKQGAIDVAFTRVLMPIKGTETHVDAAAGLLDQGK